MVPLLVILGLGLVAAGAARTHRTVLFWVALVGMLVFAAAVVLGLPVRFQVGPVPG